MWTSTDHFTWLYTTYDKTFSVDNLQALKTLATTGQHPESNHPREEGGYTLEHVNEYVRDCYPNAIFPYGTCQHLGVCVIISDAGVDQHHGISCLYPHVLAR